LSPRILVADDEADILEPLGYAFRREGFEVDCVGDGEAALEAARTGSYDLLVLDVMMPKLSGTDVCRALRAESDLPIIILSAKDAELDRVLGLELGADDYVSKPFSTAELVSRTRALLRRRELDRAAGTSTTTRQVGGIRIDFARHEVEADGRLVDLTPSEFRVLVLLSEQPERVYTRDQIMQELWRTSYVGNARACDVHISHLRRKIERDPSHPERIVTVRELGYKLVAV
jgi:two-component system response regulator RegX3